MKFYAIGLGLVAADSAKQQAAMQSETGKTIGSIEWFVDGLNSQITFQPTIWGNDYYEAIDFAEVAGKKIDFEVGYSSPNDSSVVADWC